VYYYVTVTNTIPENGDGGTKTASVTSNTAKVTVTAAFASVAEVTAYLSTVSGGLTDTDPVPLPVGMQLSQANWTALLGAIQTGGKYVDLDLSVCTRGTLSYNYGFNLYELGLDKDGFFAPGTVDTAETGESRIVSLTLPDSAVSLMGGGPSFAPYGNFTSLKSIGGKHITTINIQSLRFITSLTTADFPAARSIGSGVFEYCSALTTVNLPAAEYIGTGAFFSCTALTGVSLPASLATVGGNPFYFCPNLTAITVDPSNPSFSASPDGRMLLDKTGTVLIGYPSAAGSVTLGAAITSVGTGAFAGAGLTSVYIPNAAIIGLGAFGMCGALTSVSLPVALSIGEDAFIECYALQTLNLPAVTGIAQRAFAECTSLATVNLSTVETIGSRAFMGCTGLTSVTLLKVTNIPTYAFAGCENLITVNLPAATGIGYAAFSGCFNLTTMNLPSVKTIGERAFDGCSRMVTLSLPAVTSISYQAFQDCNSLTTLNLPASPPGLAYNAFEDTNLWIGAGTTLNITVPTGKVSAYTSAWGVADDTAAEGNTAKYGERHKQIVITDTDTP
jgi:hypothetical protein